MNKAILIGILTLLMIGCKPNIDTSSPETTISGLIAHYDHVKDPSEVTALGRPYSEEVDVVVLEKNIRGAYPSFKISGDKIVPVQYPGSYSEMTPEEFVDYVAKLR